MRMRTITGTFLRRNAGNERILYRRWPHCRSYLR